MQKVLNIISVICIPWNLFLLLAPAFAAGLGGEGGSQSYIHYAQTLLLVWVVPSIIGVVLLGLDIKSRPLILNEAARLTLSVLVLLAALFPTILIQFHFFS
jgi:hypothetical protein